MFFEMSVMGLIGSPVARIVSQEGGGNNGTLLGTPYQTPTLKPEVLFHLGPVPVTNSMLMSLVVVIVMTLIAIWLTRRMKLIPTGRQNFIEWVMEGVLGLVEPAAGTRVGRILLPLIGTLFIYILIANWASLIPGVGTILWKNPEGHYVPLLRAPNADLNMTLSMAVLTIIIVQVAGIAANGVGGHFKAFFLKLGPIYLPNPLHIVDELARVISLSIRLFANVFGGEVLLTVMLALTFSIVAHILVTAVAAIFVPVVFLGLEMFIGLIQALVFALLSLVYITLAIAGHGHEDPETVEAHAEHALQH